MNKENEMKKLNKKKLSKKELKEIFGGFERVNVDDFFDKQILPPELMICNHPIDRMPTN